VSGAVFVVHLAATLRAVTHHHHRRDTPAGDTPAW
jgi:hypothetical protein